MQEIAKEIIQDGEKVLAVILRSGDFAQGLQFHTADQDFVQVATWNYPKGKKSSTHCHKVAERLASHTQEAIYFKSGKAKAKIYSEDGNLFKETILESGDVIIILAGGHGFEILEDNTQAIEIKNGPYPGLENDRQLIDE